MRFYSLEKLINLHDNYRKVFKIDQYNLLLIQRQGELHLLESLCPHRGHPLSEADINANDLRCPHHGYQFDIVSGNLTHATEEPCRGLKVYELVYQQIDVGVML
ncbi:MAG: Rieske (2Fe-2S) protein [Pseudomonadales bacterium]